MWVKGQRLSNRIFLTPQYDVPADGSWRRKIYDLAQKEEFDLFIIGCILVNTCFMAAEHYDMDDGVALFLSIVDFLFLAVYTTEAVTFNSILYSERSSKEALLFCSQFCKLCHSLQKNQFNLT